MMDRKIITVVGLLSLLAISLAAYGQTGITAATNDPKTEAVVDANGNLRVPADYRAVYQFLGSWAVAADQGQGSKEIHVVYTSPDTIAAYRKDGHFPDGSVLVKEVFEATTAAMTTGTVSHAQKLKGWFVMVKDSKRYAATGGWGFEEFRGDSQTDRMIANEAATKCYACHISQKDRDFVFSTYRK